MNLTLYELAAADPQRRFSPYCWRTRFALAHKGLQAQTEPVRFTEKAKIAFSGQEKVPILVDGEQVISDSWAIACYLEDRYPDCPSLFGGERGRALARLVNHWVDQNLAPPVLRMLATDIVHHLDDDDAAYFRRTREARLGDSLENIAADREHAVKAFRSTLQPLRAALAENPWLSGPTPAYADYVVFSLFQWARGASAFALLGEDDALRAWRSAMLDAFDGLAREMPAYG